MLDMSGIDKQGQWNILDIGGQDVNGTVHDQLPNSKFTVLDQMNGRGVDILADAATWEPTDFYDIIIATELFEHAKEWAAIIKTAWKAIDLVGPGILITTCASDGRAPHGATGAWTPDPGEYYGNVSPDQLRAVTAQYFNYVHVEYNPNPGDAYMLAKQPLKMARYL